MGLPAYPPDWATTWRGVQRGLKQAYTGAQSRVRYAAVRAASLVLGDQQGSRIVIDPKGGPGGAPSIVFRPQRGAKVGALSATSNSYPDEVTITLQGGTNNRDTVFTQVTLGGGIVRASVRDANSGATIRNVDITEDYASIGSPSDSGKAYARIDDTSVIVQAADGGDINIGGNGGRIVVGSDGGIGLYAANGTPAIEMSPGGDGTLLGTWHGTVT